MRVLVVGGAGFIGSHLVDRLLADGYQVSILDNLDPQVHGQNAGFPKYLDKRAALQIGDVRSPEDIDIALRDVDAVFYLAAAVGVGQSMYEIRRYVEVNSLGAATFLEAVSKRPEAIKKMVVASSMSVYGEGSYIDINGCNHYPILRGEEKFASGDWEHRDGSGELLRPVPTAEDKPLYPTSVYAISKRDHEELFLSVGAGYDIPVTALRFFNVYGSRQALSNPYTGVAAIFSSLILNGKSPKVYEDGLQTRDFIHVDDIVQALMLSLEKADSNGEVFNVGSGEAVSVLQVAETLAEKLGFGGAPEVTSKFRVGDIRHCFADITKIQEKLGYAPRYKIADGFEDLTNWVKEQTAESELDSCLQQLNERNLLR